MTPNVTGKLPAPALTAEAKGANAVELNWTAVAGAARYNLALYTVADGHQRLDDVIAPVTTFTHTERTAGRTYYYWVRAVSASGEEGDWSVRKDATLSDENSATATATPTVTATPAIAPTYTVTTTAATTDRAALVALYEATDGANWSNSDNWLTDEPIYAWYGVTTDESGRVTQLSLEDNGLNGPIPDLSALNQLEHLSLDNNELSGPIPELGALNQLGLLSLASNQLSGSIPDLSALTNLRDLAPRQ